MQCSAITLYSDNAVYFSILVLTSNVVVLYKYALSLLL